MPASLLPRLGFAAAAALIALSSFGAAAAPNPFSAVAPISLSPADEAAYIRQKTDRIFGAQAPAPAAAPAPYAAPDGWQMERKAFGRGAAEISVRRDAAGDRAVLFLHGGGYVLPLRDHYRNWSHRLADVAGASKLYSVDYRASKDALFPAALEDALAAYEGLLKEGMNPAKTLVIGDSAGGNLAAVLAVALRDKGLPLPAAAVLISPWGDAGAALPSRALNFRKDRILGEVNKGLGPEIFNPSFAFGKNLRDPLVSPVYADLTGLPPMLITAGGNELFLDDAAILAAHAVRDGVKAELRIYPRMPHDWPLLLPELPATGELERDLKRFADEILGR